MSRRSIRVGCSDACCWCTIRSPSSLQARGACTTRSLACIIHTSLTFVHPPPSPQRVLPPFADQKTTNRKKSTVEPPNLKSVHRSLESLHAMGFISSPDDTGVLTDTGRFASGLGVDLELGRMVRGRKRREGGGRAISEKKASWYLWSCVMCVCVSCGCVSLLKQHGQVLGGVFRFPGGAVVFVRVATDP